MCLSFKKCVICVVLLFGYVSVQDDMPEFMGRIKAISDPICLSQFLKKSLFTWTRMNSWISCFVTTQSPLTIR